MQPYVAEPETAMGTGAGQIPELLVASTKVIGHGKTLVLPSSFRQKWQDDPIRKAEWEKELQKFDERFLGILQYLV